MCCFLRGWWAVFGVVMGDLFFPFLLRVCDGGLAFGMGVLGWYVSRNLLSIIHLY